MNDIVIRNLCKSYNGKAVLRELSLTVKAGGAVALMGPSGCGKTTLLRIIGGLERADSGTIEGGREGLAFMFQDNRLLPWKTVGENVALASDAKRAAKYLALVGLSGEEKTRPAELSGGMARRVALARCLAYADMSRSSLLLLDEPFSGVDEVGKATLIEELRRFATGRTLIFITHDINEAAALDAEVVSLGHL